MSEKNDEQEKIHEATPQKIDKARREGDIAQSKEVHGFAVYLGLLLALLLFGPFMVTRAGEILMTPLARGDAFAGAEPQALGMMAAQAMGALALALAPLVILPAGGVIASLVAQRAVTVAPKKLMPKMSRISPIAQAKQKYGPNGIADFLRTAVKMACVGAILWLVIGAEVPRIATLPLLGAGAIGLTIGELTVRFLLALAGVSVAIAAADYLWQRHSHAKKLRMSHEELKREMKEAEGDPHMKQQRRERATAIAMNQMMAEVPKATVVVVNPVHFAVALKWDRTPGTAPVCVAKGQDAIALRIRALAEEAGVPVLPDPPLARALHAALDIGDEIPPDQYRAVAAAVHFADEMRAKARKRGGAR